MPIFRERLTTSELRVALLTARGFRVTEIAHDFGVDPSAIDAHLQGAAAKLGVDSGDALRQVLGLTLFGGELDHNELEALLLALTGASHAAIGQALGRSACTARRYIQRGLSKLQVGTYTELARRAEVNGRIPLLPGGRGAIARVGTLSASELISVCLLAEGRNLAEIAAAYGWSVGSVRNQMSEIHWKLGVTTGIETVRLYLEWCATQR